MQTRRIMSRAEAQGRRVGKRVVVRGSLRLRVSAREGFGCGRRPRWDLRGFKKELDSHVRRNDRIVARARPISSASLCVLRAF
jgi:hypothetical protein